MEEQSSTIQQQSAQIHESFINQSKAATSAIEEMSIEGQKNIRVSAIKTQEEVEKALANFTQDIDKKFLIAEHAANDMGKTWAMLALN